MIKRKRVQRRKNANESRDKKKAEKIVWIWKLKAFLSIILNCSYFVTFPYSCCLRLFISVCGKKLTCGHVNVINSQTQETIVEGNLNTFKMVMKTCSTEFPKESETFFLPFLLFLYALCLALLLSSAHHRFTWWVSLAFIWP